MELYAAILFQNPKMKHHRCELFRTTIATENEDHTQMIRDYLGSRLFINNFSYFYT